MPAVLKVVLAHSLAVALLAAIHKVAILHIIIKLIQLLGQAEQVLISMDTEVRMVALV
jgi:hypothetical protein